MGQQPALLDIPQTEFGLASETNATLRCLGNSWYSVRIAPAQPQRGRGVSPKRLTPRFSFRANLRANECPCTDSNEPCIGCDGGGLPEGRFRWAARSHTTAAGASAGRTRTAHDIAKS